MGCHVCHAEAVGRCYACGRLYCAAHDIRGNCSVCATAVHVPLADKISPSAVSDPRPRAWWRPKVEEDPGPPSCYRCGGLARRVCRNCENLYCPEHAGRGDLCDSCTRSSRMALWILIGVGLSLLAIALVPLLLEKLHL
jgi:hypothetical protein